MKNVFFIAFALLAFISCNNEEMSVENVSQYGMITASMEKEKVDSRLVIDQSNNLGWTVGDAIKVFLNNGETYLYKYIEDGVFLPNDRPVPNGTDNDDVIGVLYEGGDDEGSWITGSITNNKLTSGLAQNVKYLNSPENSICLPMWGTWDNGHVTFKHMAGILRVELKNLPVDYDLLSVEASNPICGTFVVDDVTVSNPELKVETGEKLITIRFAPVTFTTQNKTLYIPLPVGTYASIEVKVSQYDENLAEGDFKNAIVLGTWVDKTVQRATIYTVNVDCN